MIACSICRYPEYTPSGQESAIDIHNRKSSNKRKERIEESRRKEELGMGIGTNTQKEVLFIPPKVPDYQPSPKEQTWPSTKIKIL